MVTKPLPARLLRDPRHLLSLGFGSGLSRWAPGTMGTLAAIPPYLLLAQLELWPYLLVLIASFVAGIYLCGFTSRALGVHDHGGIVWDEFVGFWITMTWVPVVNWQWVLIGFLFFRFFDIVKPWPVKIADRRISGGLGIMLDDVLAGMYAMAAMFLVERTVGVF